MMEFVSGANQLMVWILQWAATIALYGLIYGLLGLTLWKILAAVFKAACRRLRAVRPIRTLKHHREED